MVLDIFRDSTVGGYINYLSGGRLLPYADQRRDYAIPPQFLRRASTGARRVSFAPAVPPRAHIDGKEEDVMPPDVLPNRRASTYSVVGIEARPSSRLSNGGPTYIDRRASYTVPGSPNRLSNGRMSPYVDHRASVHSIPGFIVPQGDTALTTIREPTAVQNFRDDALMKLSEDTLTSKGDSVILALKEGGGGGRITPQMVEPNFIGWDGPNDQDNPRNWSLGKRAFVSGLISFLTFSVYIGSAIYTPSIPGIMAEFNVSLVKATAGLTLYIIGYGVGPVFLAPLQEIPAIGRVPVFMYTLAIFVALQAPIIKATNLPTILVLRFLTGFFGGLAPATGGACMADMFSLGQLPYVMGIWAVFAIAGPVAGPIVGSYAVQANGWRWTIWELLWLSSFAFVFLMFTLPETYEATILVKRARRLRKLTGNQYLHTAAEKLQQSQTVGEIAYEALVRPFLLMTEPVMIFCNIYLGFCYALFYLWFESFPLVFSEIYHFDFGNSALPFLGYFVTGILTYFFFCLYQRYHLGPRYMRAAIANKPLAPEVMLEIGLMVSILIPTSVLIFGYTSKASIHWIVPIIGASLYLPGLFMNFQSVLIYITCSYPAYAASALAGNDMFRSCIASVFPLFGRAYFRNMGLGTGSAILAGIAFGLMFCFFLLFRFGHILRARSKYANPGA
ncbi:major facilitator superfamily domain-containing protein [Mycena rosella]|uniref:Major facilitator superfamily domain-containing protein n=1 Tax=Mycena rosella TaxID=1033263 RepID=A0AAD7GCP3_MYCRO|nr:major facilitator superfamily domain-containing protein [Mycena rosella]